MLQEPGRLRVLRRDELQERLGIGRSMTYELADRTSRSFDPRFPQAVKIGARIGFMEHEVEEYLRYIMEKRQRT